jgi:HSP20 family protein
MEMARATTLVRDPFLADLRAMDELFNRFWAMTGMGRVTGFTPALDVRETDDEYVVLVDLPGVKQEDVSIELEDQLLTISGTRVPVEVGEAQHVERPYGSFTRTLNLPKGVDSEAIAASYADGVLELRIRKPAEQRTKRIPIQVGQKELTQ